MSRSKLLKIAYQLIDAFNAWDEDQIIGCRTKDCVHEFWPASVSQQRHDNAAARAEFAATREIFKNFHVRVVDHVEDPVAGRVVMFAHASMETHKGKMVLDYVLLLDISEESEKISRILQMNHPKFV
ncbi:hypothetical protein CGRA01v4_12216 [Colletotrichum graminicola]|uniref:SnoaL-like domain-containing protein n=1 Tax=Colletotrichum graminicola (strain M1.001 / M2 / FGSC 10212) TaxID=645133 RepID=E3QZS6_COLGM|nr:uncharacterized protein GLRG_11509 [Colletotrichum graminicola M1.001]EFQ36364.1 hypothetical protein GLRG_11509 [Colletotrichum graminicola M1.001]WDK20927.1 hypothetical protein CGRA01v4_12216 [Colletotrichum graminicola]